MMTLGQLEKNLRDLDLRQNEFGKFSLLGQAIVKYSLFSNDKAFEKIKESLPKELFTDRTLRSYVTVGLKYYRTNSYGLSNIPSSLIKAIDYNKKICTSQLKPAEQDKYVPGVRKGRGPGKKLSKKVIKVDNINSDNKVVSVENKRINDKIFDGNYLIRFNNAIKVVLYSGNNLDKSFSFISRLIDLYQEPDNMREIKFNCIFEDFCKYLLKDVHGDDFDAILSVINKIRNNDKKLISEVNNG